NYSNTSMSDATHAWVEVYIPWIGWVGYDPTNGCVVNSDHVRIACGRHYIDATPTAGNIYRGGGSETLSIDVKVFDIT
ncbi:transglutaminase family protein, partial [Francisella tularensis subsp. holarctica]